MNVNITVDEQRDADGRTLLYHQALCIALERSAERIPDGAHGLQFSKCKEVRQIGGFQRWKFQFVVI